MSGRCVYCNVRKKGKICSNVEMSENDTMVLVHEEAAY